MSVLDRIHSPDDVKKLSISEKNELCLDIREYLIDTISKTGGHLASNLGIVELTVAVHSVFDTAIDRLVFDVGHQSYVHKLITGRRDGFETLRSYGGIAGFPKPHESIHDAFIGGHASDAVSIALGMARARTLSGENYNVITVLGDGALTGGLAYEGLSDAGESGEPIIVVLNDNGMSITENVGGVARYLSHQRLKPQYFSFKRAYHRFVGWLPGGKYLYKFTHWLKERIKSLLLGRTMFEEMGFAYLGPVDGHDIERLTYLLEWAKELNCPVLLHIVTQKGRGYKYSELNPNEFHGISGFDIVSGELVKSDGYSYSSVFGHTTQAMAREDERIIAITAAMSTGTGLDGFAAEFPDRFFDVGIAEGHAVSLACGMAKQGFLPIFAVYSTFLQRSYDMLIHDTAILGLHVVFAVDRAGLVGEDGETHHGVFDVAMLTSVPKMTILCPASNQELISSLRRAVYDLDGPVAVRYPRGGEGEYNADHSAETVSLLAAGTDITIVSYGNMINNAVAASKLLRQGGIHSDVIKINQIWPLDMSLILKSIKKTRRIMIVEECVQSGCIGEKIAAALSTEGIATDFVILKNLGNDFIGHGAVETLISEAGLDSNGLYKAVKEVWNNGHPKAGCTTA